jgi:beta-lactamase superfamily II metal-dependent hydrolase
VAHKATFYPEGNADTCLIEPEGGGLFFFDYADKHNDEDDGDLRVDLSAALGEKLEASGRDGFDVVAISHLDDDHIHGASEFFYLDHALKYQIGERAKIEELWVPSAAITDDSLKGEAKVIQAEARHRLRQGEGIRVFSRPAALTNWLEDQGLTIEERQHLITDAGQLVPNFSKEIDGVEFFVHSPFAHRQSATELVVRNQHALALQVTFRYGADFRLFLSADSAHEELADIVRITRGHDNEERLMWDVMKIAHHASYKSLGPEKGTVVTEPVEEVQALLEEYGQRGGILVASSRLVPTDESDTDPPHRQAVAYYEKLARHLGGEFKMTMAHPKPSRPEPLVIIIDGTGARIEKIIPAGSLGITTSRAPRAGRRPPRAG